MPFDIAIAGGIAGAGIVLGLLVGWVMAGRGWADRLAERMTKEDGLKAALDQATEVVSSQRAEIAGLGATLESERRGHQEKLRELENVRGQIKKDLKVLMSELLDSSSKSFVERANEVLKMQQEKGEAGMTFPLL